MFQKIASTIHPPSARPVMLWDGDCSFCKYWVTRWQTITGDLIEFIPYQEGAKRFPDIDENLFRQASRLIDSDGLIYSGPDSAYRSVYLAGKYKMLHRWYSGSSPFRSLSDSLYNIIAQRRNIMFRLTKAMWGSDPLNPKPFWVIYLGLILYLVYINWP